MSGRHIVADAEGVRVMAERCPTCIFRPGNLMHLEPGRAADMAEQAVAAGGQVPCHSTFDNPKQAICRGYWDQHRHRVVLLRSVEALGLVVYHRPEDKESG